jgi:mannosyltransferase OCH1-like enzyme
MIPKIIWQTHENEYNDLLPFQKDITNTWKNLNPGWEYRYVDAKARAKEVKEYNDVLYKYYTVCDKIRQSDIWRLVAIYNYGGFYADMDSVCIQSIEDSLHKNYNNEEMVCSPKGFQHPGVNNSNFGSKKNSKIIKLMIEQIEEEYKKIKLQDIKNLVFGFPENHIFSNIVQQNQNSIYFNSEYFSHASGYKKAFNSNLDVTINNSKVNYHTVCINNNWPIYYI